MKSNRLRSIVTAPPAEALSNTSATNVSKVVWLKASKLRAPFRDVREEVVFLAVRSTLDEACLPDAAWGKVRLWPWMGDCRDDFAGTALRFLAWAGRWPEELGFGLGRVLAWLVVLGTGRWLLACDVAFRDGPGFGAAALVVLAAGRLIGCFIVGLRLGTRFIDTHQDGGSLTQTIIVRMFYSGDSWGHRRRDASLSGRP